jgi:glycosyltransferase involved in cell wall biosynthesis
MNPLVSILIPAYNAERWLSATIRSALSQTWDNKEIIVVDDGSSDHTVTVARQFEADRVRVVTQKNQGAAAARNTAYSVSHGEYVQWLDADDLIAPDKIARQLAALDGRRHPRLLLSAEWGRFMAAAPRATFVPTALWCDLSAREWLTRKMEHNIYMQTACWLVSRELTEMAGPWDPRLVVDDDGEYFCRVLLASDGVRFVPGAKVYYRASGVSSLSYMGGSHKKRDALWLSMNRHIECLRALDSSGRARAACVKFLQDSMVFFYPERLDIFEQAAEMARTLGGELRPPRVSWKYRWIEVTCGRLCARRVEVFVQDLKWSVLRMLETSMERLASRKRPLDLRI